MENCLSLCKSNKDCSHFSWYAGTCYLKKGNKTMTDKLNNTATACGCINCSEDRQEWGCDFRGGDLATASSSQWQSCTEICKAREDCTHFSWMNGICYLKTGGKTMEDKFSNSVTACGCIKCA